MAVKSSGALSFATDIVGEFSDSTPHSLSEFYKGGGKVPDAAGNGNVPTSGAISMGDFYGAVNRIAISLTISSNTNNYNIFSSKGGSYVAGISDVTLTINSSAAVGSTSTGTYALDTGTGWSTGDTITIVNNGTVKGRGGNGGPGQQRIEGSTDNAIYPAGTTVGNTAPSGNAGGHAFRAQFAVSFTNNGSVYGGGGGGGGAGMRSFAGFKGDPDSFNGGGGGGGGAGVNAGSGGPGGTGYSGTSVMTSRNGPSGSSGTATAGGAGGDDASSSSDVYAAGGSGGGLGANGSTGETGYTVLGFQSLPGGPGGSRGRYQTGASFINSGSGIGGTVGGGSS